MFLHLPPLWLLILNREPFWVIIIKDYLDSNQLLKVALVSEELCLLASFPKPSHLLIPESEVPLSKWPFYSIWQHLKYCWKNFSEAFLARRKPFMLVMMHYDLCNCIFNMVAPWIDHNIGNFTIDHLTTFTVTRAQDWCHDMIWPSVNTQIWALRDKAVPKRELKDQRNMEAHSIVW